MKRVLLLLAAGTLAFAAAPSVVTTKHNLSATGTMALTDYTQVCKFCHSPHGAQAGTAQIIPLWGHMTTSTVFPIYASDSLKGTIAQPNGPSLACLSCHDGTVAVNARYTYVDVDPGTSNRGTYGNMGTSTTATTDFTITTDKTGRKLGFMINAKNDLSTIHPVNVEYNTSKNPELHAQADAIAAGVRLWNNTVHCASCHEPHGSTNSMFLRVTSTGSALCLACHIK